MPALITDQFRINNANNFISSIEDETNSYYVFLGLPNPREDLFGRSDNWQTTENLSGIVPNPTDNENFNSHYKDTALFGKKITSSNARRVIRRVDWVAGKKYDMYRHDYSSANLTPVTQKARLYDSNFYVVNSEYKVYICLYNGSSGVNSSGNASQDEPTFTDLEPSRAGQSGDGYIWKYLFTISPSDIIKFDSTEYIVLPNNWSTTSESQIVSVRENADSSQNNNQLKTIYIEDSGSAYITGSYTVDILGDGIGAKAFIVVNNSGEIETATVVAGGSGYTYGLVDLGICRPQNFNSPGSRPAKLIPIIPPSLGHGYDIYKELGADRVLIYSRFDDSTLDFPSDTKFSQIGILKNPTKFLSTETYAESQFSNLYSLKFNNPSSIPSVGDKIQQVQQNNVDISVGYVASFNPTTGVLKYFKDRSLYFGNGLDHTDYVGISSRGKATVDFSSTGLNVTSPGFSANIDVNFSGITTTLNGQIINLSSEFTNGVSNPEINNNTGDMIYIDNRSLVARNLRQKEDVKIILEF
jgi:hypothetical protein